MASDDHVAAVRSASVTLDAVQERIGDPVGRARLDDAQEVLGDYLGALEERDFDVPPPGHAICQFCGHAAPRDDLVEHVRDEHEAELGGDQQ